MDMDFSPEEKRLIIQFLANATYPISEEEQKTIWKLADAIEDCASAGCSLHIN